MIRLTLMRSASCLRIACSLSLAVLIGCGNEAVSTNNPPIAAFAVADEPRTAPITVQFDGSGSSDSDGEIVSHNWSFGNGAEASGAIVEHKFETEGNYEITLTVIDDQGATANSTQTLVITPAANVPPVAVIATNQKRGLAPLDIQLSASKSKDEDGEISAYFWQFADGSVSTEATVDRTYNVPGDYLVSLTVTDNDGAQAEDTMTITVLEDGVTFSLSGTITALPYTDVDGDVNDPFADYFNNNGHGNIAFQPITNPVLLNGFISDRQTGGDTDRFAFEADSHDIYLVELTQGDYASLQVIDIDFADIDLYLLDANTGDVVAFSTGNNEFESVQAPATDEYLLMVFAENYFSKYLLKVGESSLVAGPQASGSSVDFEPDQAIIKFRSSAASGHRSNTNGRNGRGGRVTTQSTAERAQLELSHQNKGRAALAKLNRMNPQLRSSLQLQAQAGGFESWLGQKNPAALAKLETIRALTQLARQPDVEFAEPNYRVKPSYIPSDPNYRYQWHYPAINLPQAWDITTGDPSVVVAVIDSGVFLAHPELQGKLTVGFDFISLPSYANDGDDHIDADPDDPGDSVSIGGSSWHGTHVTGTVVAAMDNGVGGVGVAPEARVMPLRALGRGGGLAYDILQAVRYAAGMENDSLTVPERPADIINLSLGGSGYSQASQNLYSEVRNKGIIVIAAAGNENTDEPMYPASYDGVISVAASDFNGNRAPYSNRGAFIDVTAPGGLATADANGDGFSDGILSSVVDEQSDVPEGGYVFYQGTSMAAPHVAGVAALMKSVHPGLSAEEFESLLISGAITIDKGDPGRDHEYGYGLIDAQLAVNAARSLADGALIAAVYADRNVLAFDDMTSQMQIEIRSIGNDAIAIVDVATDSDWLTVTEGDVDANGIGTYTVSVDNAGLEDGAYRGLVRFESDRQTQIQVQVNLRVGEVVPIGNAGLLYVLLISAETGNVAVREVAPEEGRYEYSFTNIPVGDYYVAAGSDVDNDDFVCDAGESCGFYPSIADFTLIRLDNDKPGTDFGAGLSETLGTQSSKNTNEGLSRRVVP